MTTSTRTDDAYLLGSSEAEHRRLIRQGELINPFTLRLLAEAGISRGMHVLDVGTGAGDVELMAAELVGSTGAVVGIDRDPDALEVARTRAESAGLANVTFQEGDINAIATAQEIGIETLASRLRAETLAADAVVRAADLVGAWARRPAA